MASPCTGDSDTTRPIPVVSDDLASSEHEAHTSDVSSTDEDDFQPFALPDGADELADGPPVEYLPLVEIPAPIPLAVYPAYDLLLDAEADGDIDLYDDEPIEDDDLLEDEIQDAALLPAGDLLMIADAPAEDSPAHSPPMEDPADPVDPIDLEFDFEMAFDDPEPAVAPEQAVALDPILDHDPVHIDIPIEPVLADPPIDDHLMDAPLLEGDHVVAVDPAVPPPVVDIPVDHPVDHIAPVHPIVASPPDPEIDDNPTRNLLRMD
ncbi:magnetosome-associated protein MamJ-like [Helianthus annuus]|uniref:magnetosome-associated protein MamJ-like n=1 Tax=Helianthus annuus TaxID=4232 RepID=UPI00165336E2|nr:magnetosome-associated protein MamJ-like [Helianthus annuus]